MGRAMIVIKPAGVAEVLDTGFNLARRQYRPLAIASAWGIVPPTTVQAILTALLASAPEQGTGLAVLLGLSSLLAVFGAILASMAVTIGCARLIEAADGPPDLSLGGLYRAAVGRLPTLIVFSIVVLFASIPLIILFPLGVYVYVRWLVSWVALLVERTGPLASLGRSWTLTGGFWWHTMVIGLAATLIIWVLNAVVGGIFQGIGGILAFVFGGVLIGAVVTGLGGAIAFPLTEPFSAAILVVLYYELRARKEGFDLEQRARYLASTT